MQPFLSKTAAHLLQQYGNDISRICVVFPNRRSGLFFKKFLGQQIEKPIWSPEVLSMEDFVESLCDKEVLDPIGLLFRFYEVYKETEGKKAQPFDEFANWASVLLNDFGELDKGYADIPKFFQYLSADRAMEVWSPDRTDLTPFQKQYLGFWQSLGKYYKGLTENLEHRNQIARGMTFRLAADNIVQLVNAKEWKTVVFVGFTEFNNAEEHLVKKLLEEGRAEVLWDADAYYVDDETQEAGAPIRKYKKEWKLEKLNWVEDLISTTDKNIHVIGVPKNIGQVEVAGQLLSELDEEALNKTAVILADENLLTPLLHALPGNVGKVNITMGYPIKATPLHQLLQLILKAQTNAHDLNQSGKAGGFSFYHKDVLAILGHPYTMTLTDVKGDGLFAGQDDFCTQLADNIHANNLVFLSPETLKELGAGISPASFERIRSLFTDWEDKPQAAINELTEIISLLKEKYGNPTETPEEAEYLFQYAKILNRLQSLVEEFQSVTSIKSLRKLMVQIAENTSLSFQGEPLDGLQILSILDSRALDFEHLILLSVNEGLWPPGKSANSFIPFDMRREFELPTHRDTDAVYAYLFYRLFQRSANIHITYNTQTDDFGAGEKSRYINQLAFELPQFDKANMHLLEVPLSNDMLLKERDITIEKDEAIIQLLREKAQYGFSASALNRYRTCSLQFYFHDLMRLKEKEAIEETIDAATLGSVIHGVLEDLYKPLKDKPLTEEHIKAMRPQLESLSREAFKREYKKGSLDHGKNLLTVKVALKFLNRFLDEESALLKKGNKIIVTGLEQELKATVEVAGHTVNFEGKADRIDHFDEFTRIIDYKTGGVQPSELKVKDWEDLPDNANLNKAFQLLFYAWLYQRQGGQNIQSGIYSLKQMSNGLSTVITPEGGQQLSDEAITHFQTYLESIIVALFDTGISFSQTEDRKRCEWCAFRGICKR